MACTSSSIAPCMLAGIVWMHGVGKDAIKNGPTSTSTTPPHRATSRRVRTPSAMAPNPTTPPHREGNATMPADTNEAGDATPTIYRRTPTRKATLHRPLPQIKGLLPVQKAH